MALPTPAEAVPPAAADCPGATDLFCDAAGSILTNGTAAGLAAQGLQQAGSSGLSSLAEDAFGQMAQKFGEAGISFLQSLAAVFVESSTVNLSASGIDPVLAITMPIAMLVAVLLVVTAAGKTAATGNGSVLATALVGLVKTVLVTVLLVAVVQMALKASDALSAWIIERSLGSNRQLERRLGSLISLDALNGSPALVLLFGLLAIVIGLILWVELLFRRVAIVVLVAIAPIAATGQILDSTGEWWTKARNALIQLILLKPVMALCFAVGFATFGSARDLTGVVAGFVTLGLAAVAWPLLARFMTFTTAGGGHAALTGLVSTTAGFLAGRRIGSGAPVSGPGAHAGTAYTTALEQSNDHAAAGWLRGGGRAGGSAGMLGGSAGGGVVAVVGATASAGSAVLDHVESQVSSAAADAGLGSASSPRGHYGTTRGRFARRRGSGAVTSPAVPVSGADRQPAVQPAYAPVDTATQETPAVEQPPSGQEGPRL